MSQSLMIIGAGPGIGQAVAERFGREGWTIVLTGRDIHRLDGMAATLSNQGIACHAVPADAADPQALNAAVAHADLLTGGLTAIHYNAAVVRNQDLFSMRDEELLSDLAINVAGGLNTIRAAVQHFGSRGGTILVTGGGLGVDPQADWASLGLGKAALRNVVQGLAPSLAARNIHIRLATVATLVAPGSAEAQGIADSFWHMATDPSTPWETVYPKPKVVTQPLTLIARLTAKPDCAEALGAGLRALIEPTLTEPGALAYRVHRDRDDPDVWILYETWASQADLDVHFAKPYTKALMTQFPKLLAREMELNFATEQAAA